MQRYSYEPKAKEDWRRFGFHRLTSAVLLRWLVAKLLLLGGARLQGGDAPLPPDQTLWVTALLAARGQPLSRARLSGLLWPDAEADAAKNRLRQLLHRLKRSPLGAGLRVDAATLAWVGACDVAEFRAHLGAHAWADALRTYSGPFLDGVALPEHEALDAWLHETRAALHDEHLRAAHEAARAHEARGELPQAVEALARAFTADPASDATAVRLARHLHVLGDAERALRVLERHREHLARELHEAPSAEVDALDARVRATLGSAGVVANAPSFPTTFEGRDAELDVLAARLADPACRWLTLTGPGGAGKTRLAAEAARRAAGRFAHGAVFVPLVSLATPDLIVPGVLDALGEPPDGQGAPFERLCGALASRHVLLVLDNYEHLLEGAEVLPALLERCPDVKVLVTSRQRLNYQREWVVNVAGLDHAAPSGGTPDWRAFPASRLFVERARRADAHFDADAAPAAVDAIVRRCEGLPLALELAAAWAADFGPEDIARRLAQDWDFLVTTLRDMPPRHRSLRVVFEHSWRALSPELQRVYAALAVLRTPFDADTAARVAGATTRDLERLAQRSLLQRREDGHFTWHQNLREFAWRQLDDATAAQVREQHLAHFVALAEDAAPHLRGARQAQEHARLAQCQDDLRAALEQARAAQRVEAGLRLAGALRHFWYVRGHHEEGLRWLNVFLPAAATTPIRARAVAAAGALSAERGLHGDAARHYQDALGMYQAAGDPRGEAEVLHMLGVLRRTLGDWDAAKTHLEAARALHEQLDDAYGLGMTLNDLGIGYAQHGDDGRARELFQRSLDLKRRAQDWQGVAYALANLGAVAATREEELRLYEESLAIKRSLGDVQGSANTIANCAMVALDLGDLPGAHTRFEEAITLFRQLGKYTSLGPLLAEVARLKHLQGDHAGALELGSATLHLERHTGAPLREATRAGLTALLNDVRPLVQGAAEVEGRGARRTPDEALCLALGAPLEPALPPAATPF